MSNILDKIQLSGTTYTIVDSTAIHSTDGYWTSGQTNNAITAATNALAESIAEQGYQTSGDVQNAISGKADTTAVTQSINEAVSGKADVNVAVTDVALDTNGNALFLKQTKNGNTTNVGVLDGGTGIKIETPAGAIRHKIYVDTTVIAQKTDIPSVTPYADSVKYNSTSKEVEFYHGGTGGTKVFSYDASPFLIDGMVQNVEIKDVTISGESVTCLVISFNTDAGKQDINVPLTDIFDANNYYTKTEVDNAITAATDGLAVATAVTQEISEATSGKADSSTVTGINDVLTAHTADTTIHVTSSDKTTWSGKQDALVSGTNIKTINGNSLLGSGDITVQTLPTINGTTLVFS